jgi:RND superfamily putative drug exporter
VTIGHRLASIPSGRRTKWLVLLLWIGLSVFAFTAGPKLTDVQRNGESTFLPESAEATRVAALDDAFRGSDLVPAVIVYERGDGITAADRQLAEADRKALAGVEGVVPPIAPVVESDDGQALQLTILVDDSGNFRTLPEKVEAIRSVADDGDGLTVRVTGPAGAAGDFLDAFGDINTRLVLLTALVVIVILLLTYRSPVLWILPIIAVLIADYLAQGVNYVLASNDLVVVNGQTASILLILVFGAGTDYALLLISRYREELRRHEDRHEAMTEALAKSAGAISASAMTVALSLMVLLVASLESTRGLGPVAAVGILCAMFAMLTLLPALLVITGRWVFWPFTPRFGSEVPEASSLWTRVGSRVAKAPRAVWMATTVLLVAMALGATALNTDGIDPQDQFRTTVGSVEGQEIVSRHFDDGQGTPAIIVGPADQAAEVLEVVAADPGVASVSEPRTADGLVRFEATLTDEPDSDAAFATVGSLRTSLDEVSRDALVGGEDAVTKDVREAAAADRRVVIPLVLLVVLAVLILLLRAVTVSVLLVATVVVSFFAALGLSALVFELVLGITDVDQNYTLFVFLFLVALGVDYNIFLMTRVREESRRRGTRAGMLEGLAVTGGVITSAGVVLAATFAILATLPITPLFQIGVTVALGVLLDTVIVRSVLVPALTLDIGPPVWWPSALWRSEVDHRGDASGPGAPEQDLGADGDGSVAPVPGGATGRG